MANESTSSNEFPANMLVFKEEEDGDRRHKKAEESDEDDSFGV